MDFFIRRNFKWVPVAFAIGLVLVLGGPTEALARKRPPTRYQQVQTFMRKVMTENPQTTQLITIGTSNTGEPIEALKIGNGPVRNLVVSTHHGNEYGSTEVAKAFAESVAKSPVQGQTVFVVPVLNVSGYNRLNRYEQGRDPNRDYPGPCGSEGPFGLKSTAALAQLIANEGIVSSATLHTFSPAVLYPWGLSAQGNDLVTPYDALFKKLSELAAQDSGYSVGNSTELLYPADGAFEDYAYWKHGIWSLLFELGFSHNPDVNAVQKMIEGNVPGLRRFFENAPTKRAEDHAFKGACINATERKRMGMRMRHDE